MWSSLSDGKYSSRGASRCYRAKDVPLVLTSRKSFRIANAEARNHRPRRSELVVVVVVEGRVAAFREKGNSMIYPYRAHPGDPPSLIRHTRMFSGLFRKEENRRLIRLGVARPVVREAETSVNKARVLRGRGCIYVREDRGNGRWECKCARLGRHAPPHALVHTLQCWLHAEYTCTPRSGAGPGRSAPDREIKEKRNGAEEEEEEEEERKEGETRSICKPRRIAYFKTITERFSCPEDDGIALSFVRPAVKNDPRQRSFPLPEFHRAPFHPLFIHSGR